MKKTHDMLIVLFWSQLIVPAIIYVCCEYLNVDLAFLAGTSENGRYVVSTVMILATLALLPLALRLFKFQRIHNDLIERRADALHKWGIIRLIILGDLLLINTLLYYAYGFESAFGYLAVVTLLAMPFVYPTMERCYAEVEDEKTSVESEESPSEESTSEE